MHTFLKRILGVTMLLTALGSAASAQQNLLRLAGVAVSTSPTPNGSLSSFNDGNTSDNPDVYYNVSSLHDSVWVQFKLPTAQVAGTYQIYWWEGGNTYGANNILLYGSQDGVSWALINQNQGNPPPLPLDFPNTTAYLYYRFVFKQYNSTSYLDFDEIELYNNVIAAPALAATSPFGSQLNISWNATITGSGTYELQKSTDGINFSLLKSAGYTVTSYIDTGLVQATAYWYRVRAIKGTTTTAFSTVLKATTANDALLGKPTINAVPGNIGTVANISWGLSPFVTAGSYQLEKSTDGANFTLFKTFDKTVVSYADSTLARSTSYWYRVKGVNYTSSSAYSAIAKVTTISDSLLTAPSLTATASTTIGTQAALSWSLSFALPGSFELEKSTDGTNFTLFKTFDKAITAYTDSTLTHNTAYWYRVRGRNVVSASPYSITRMITTRNDSLLVAPALQAGVASGTEVNLSWTLAALPAGSAGFEVDISTNGTDFALLGKFPVTTTTYTQESLTPNTSYWYRVRAYNYINVSPWSPVVPVTTNSSRSSPADITNDGGKLYVSAENSSGANSTEGSSKLIDNDFTTKWLVYTGQASGNLSAVYKPTGAYIVTGYGLVTGGDMPPRDPKNWVFEGSADSATWTTLDTRSNQLGATAARQVLFNYTIASPGTTAFKFYRVTFTANNGATDGVRFQLSEWLIFGLDTTAPDIPVNLTVTNTTVNTVSLGWTGSAARPATKYVLQRSLDGLYFNLVDTLAGNVVTYTDTARYDSTNYYYRIEALGVKPTAVSGWSNIAKALTKFTAGTPLTPINLKVGTVVDSVVNLTWTDRSYNETGFRLQRSVDNINFTDVLNLAVNAASASDSTVWSATKYYYRVAAINGQVSSAYSNVDSAVTTGFNSAPVLTVPLLVKNACSNTRLIAAYISNLAPGGTQAEQTQQLRVTSVAGADTTSAKYFSSFSFIPAVINGVASFGFTGSGFGNTGDTATLVVTIKDNGGTKAGGADSLQVLLKVTFVPLAVTISADKDITALPKYTEAHLTASTNYASTTPGYAWADADGILGSRNNIILRVMPLKPTVYAVSVTNTDGCTASAQILVTPFSERSVSNVLTPNGDGKNDKWVIWGITQNPNNSVKVFDRAGRLVFFQRNYNNDWDGRYNGKVLDEGAYYYVVDYGDGTKPITGVLNIVHDH